MKVCHTGLIILGGGEIRACVSKSCKNLTVAMKHSLFPFNQFCDFLIVFVMEVSDIQFFFISSGVKRINQLFENSKYELYSLVYLYMYTYVSRCELNWPRWYV